MRRLMQPLGRTATIIGIDCAVDPKRVGLAVGRFRPGRRLQIRSVHLGPWRASLAASLSDWIDPRRPTLLALDAPLGWPQTLGDRLARHEAGAPLPIEASRLFRRHTDLVVHDRLGKLPLEVGADRIARTGHAALALLDQLRGASRRAIPLAWSPRGVRQIGAIEVYPAATLRSHRFEARGYRATEATDVRRALLRRVKDRADLPAKTSLLVRSPDAFDAVLCVLAGADFLSGMAVPPTDRQRARREGWIWFRAPVAD